MSEFRVPVVKLGKIGKHPNADSLSITTIEGCPVIFKTGDFNEGDVAVYIPVDAVVPETVPGTEFLGKHRRIKAKRLRGIFSMGLLLSPGVPNESLIIPITAQVGDNVGPELGITKYEEPEPTHFAGEDASAPSGISVPVYDIESHRKYRDVFEPDEKVVVTEKIHGCNGRFLFHDGQLHVGSHKRWKKEGNTLWWRVAKEYGLAEKLAKFPDFVFYGEVYGAVQDLRYGCEKDELRLDIFDIYDAKTGRWLNWQEVEDTVLECDLITVPTLYIGRYIPEVIEPMCDGNTIVMHGITQIREGIVIKPLKERWDNKLGRVITKLVGEEYLTRKGGTELH